MATIGLIVTRKTGVVKGYWFRECFSASEIFTSRFSIRGLGKQNKNDLVVIKVTQN